MAPMPSASRRPRWCRRRRSPEHAERVAQVLEEGFHGPPSAAIPVSQSYLRAILQNHYVIAMRVPPQLFDDVHVDDRRAVNTGEPASIERRLEGTQEAQMQMRVRSRAPETC